MIQLISITHAGSHIQKTIFFSVEGDACSFEFQAVPPRSWNMETVRKPLTRDEVLDSLRVWRDLDAEGELLRCVFDAITLKVVTGVSSLALVPGEAPSQEAA